MQQAQQNINNNNQSGYGYGTAVNNQVQQNMANA